MSRRAWLHVTLALLVCLPGLWPAHAAAPKHAVTGARVMQLTRQFLAVAPKRYLGSPGHVAAENFIKAHFAPEAAKGNLVADSFMATTPIGPLAMTNYIVKFPSANAAKRDSVIVLASHYETNYPLKDVAFFGANDGACTSALLMALGEYYRAHPPQGSSVWLLFDDGEEAVKSWTASDSLYGTRHLAAKWSADGTLPKIKAVAIADMIGDKDLNILEESQSTGWLRAALMSAAKDTGHTANVFKTRGAEEDDHLPFLSRGVPTIDVIDVDYGPHTADQPDGYHHTPGDTLDHISAASLGISADLLLALVLQIDAH